MQQSSYVGKISKFVSNIIFYQNYLFAHTWHASKPYLQSCKTRFQKYWWNPHFFVAKFVHFLQRKNAVSTSTFESIFFKISKKSLFLIVLYFFRYVHQDDISFSEGHHDIVGKVCKHNNDIGTNICAVRVRSNW